MNIIYLFSSISATKMTEPPKLSLVAQFDDLMRCVWGLLNNDETEAFLAIVLNFEEFCLKGIEAEKECQRLQSELNKQMLTISNLEKKLSHARSMYDTEKRQRLKAEHEIENLVRWFEYILLFIQPK